VVAHALSSELRVALFDCFDNSAMLAGRQLAVVSKVERCVHDAFHLAAHVCDSTNKQRISSELRDADVKLGIGFDKLNMALAVLAAILSLREFFEAFDRARIPIALRG